MYISYKNILSKAWQITWRGKMLWLFGIFASFVSLEGVYEIILSQINQAKSKELLYSNILNQYSSQTNFVHTNIYFLNWLPNNYSAYLLFVLLGLLAVIFIWLAYVSQIYIIKSSALIYKNNKLASGKVLSESTKKFWPVFGINILAKLLLYAAFIALSLPIFYSLIAQNQNALTAANIFYFLSFAVIAIIIGFLSAYATNFIVLKNLSIIEAIKDAWFLFAKNIIVSLEIALVLFLLKIFSLIIIFSLFFLFLVPLAITLFILLSANSLIGFVIILTLIILIFTLISLLINAIYTVFFLSTWTIAFIKMTEETIFAKIVDFISGLPGIFRKTMDKHNLKINKDELQLKASALSQKVQKTYEQYKPEIQRQSKIAAQQIKKAYNEFEPIIKKEISELIAESKQKAPAKTKKRKSTHKKSI